MATKPKKAINPDPNAKPRKNTKLTKELLTGIVATNPNLTTRQIGRLTDTTHGAVVVALQKFGITREAVEEFKSNRADIFAGLQRRVLASFTDEEIKNASVRDKTILMGTLYDKERLERGLSTQNTAVLMANAVIESDKE